MCSNQYCELNPFACNSNGSNRSIYDDCYYAHQVHDETSPFIYQMYEGKYENCGKCRKDNFYHPYDLVDVESELRNETRPMSRCGGWKYNPNYNIPACRTFKSQPTMYENPTKRYYYNDNPLNKQISHYYAQSQPNIGKCCSMSMQCRPNNQNKSRPPRPVNKSRKSLFESIVSKITNNSSTTSNQNKATVPPSSTTSSTTSTSVPTTTTTIETPDSTTTTIESPSTTSTQDIIAAVGSEAIATDEPVTATTTTTNDDNTITVTDIVAEPTDDSVIITETSTDAVVTNDGTTEGFTPIRSRKNKKVIKKEYFGNICRNNQLSSSTCRCNLRGFSTFDPSVPVVYPPELCPIVFNNIKKPTNPGYYIPRYI